MPSGDRRDFLTILVRCSSSKNSAGILQLAISLAATV
jgi:hypothetical protein